MPWAFDGLWAMRSRSFAGLLALQAAIFFVAGCQPQIQWQVGWYNDVQSRASNQKKLTFVYFRLWTSITCTNFEEQVLKRADVVAALSDLVCIPLEYQWDSPIANKWGLTEPPAFAIIAPDGRVLASGQSKVTAESLLEAIRRAKAAVTGEPRAPATQPNRTVVP